MSSSQQCCNTTGLIRSLLQVASKHYNFKIQHEHCILCYEREWLAIMQTQESTQNGQWNCTATKRMALQSSNNCMSLIHKQWSSTRAHTHTLVPTGAETIICGVETIATYP